MDSAIAPGVDLSDLRVLDVRGNGAIAVSDELLEAQDRVAQRLQDAVDAHESQLADLSEDVSAQEAGIQFGRIAMRHGVIVLSHPNGLAKAANKLYLNTYPRDVRPRTLVTRSGSPRQVIEGGPQKQT